MSHLFRSFYLNKQMCTPDDKAFIKKTFSQIVKQESVSHSMKAVEGFVAGKIIPYGGQGLRDFN